MLPPVVAARGPRAALRAALVLADARECGAGALAGHDPDGEDSLGKVLEGHAADVVPARVELALAVHEDVDRRDPGVLRAVELELGLPAVDAALRSSPSRGQ